MKTHAVGRVVYLALLLLTALATTGRGQGAGGHLLIVGGGLRPSNTAVYQRFVDGAGGAKKARIGVLPTASVEPPDADELKFILGQLGVPAEQVNLVDIRVNNADASAYDMEICKELDKCTGIFFQGGDQTRITGALMKPDGSDTPALAAIRGVLKRGGMIAGSSAGAAAQSKVMISVSGLPNDSLDEGLDALDFGMTREGTRRGLLNTPGLAFFQTGIIDQHFGQYRGRLGRLARAACDNGMRFGFGIDENTGIHVFPDGAMEVVGEGSVTIVDAEQAKCTDGALGCSITGLRLTVLKDADRFDPKTGAKPGAHKKLIPRGTESHNGNFLIPDISGSGAVSLALFPGLGDNTSLKQLGVTIKHHPYQAHGYRFTFRKADDTQFVEGRRNGIYSCAVLNARLDIEPIGGEVWDTKQELPRDLPSPNEPGREALTALWRRGILCQNKRERLRPHANITRGELAWAIAHTIALEPVRGKQPVIADLVADAHESESISLVVGQRLMDLDDKQRFRPKAKVSFQEAASILVRLAERYRPSALTEDKATAKLPAKEFERVDEKQRPAVLLAVSSGLLRAEPATFDPDAPLDRQQAAEAIYRLIAFSWSKTVP